MIWQPKPGQKVRINYKNKGMPLQDAEGTVLFAAKGRGPQNVLVKFIGIHTDIFEILPKGNLNAI